MMAAPAVTVTKPSERAVMPGTVGVARAGVLLLAAVDAVDQKAGNLRTGRSISHTASLDLAY